MNSSPFLGIGGDSLGGMVGGPTAISFGGLAGGRSTGALNSFGGRRGGPLSMGGGDGGCGSFGGSGIGGLP